MDAARIVVTVRVDGTIEAETHGVTGAACLDYIARLEDLIDAGTVASRFTEDYHAASSSASVHTTTTNEVSA